MIPANPLDFTGKAVLVTSGGRGIAEVFVAAGARGLTTVGASFDHASLSRRAIT